MTASFPPAPPPPPPAAEPSGPPAPRELRAVVILLVINLGLSLVLTVVTVLTRHSIIDYQLDHRHIADPHTRETVRKSYEYGVIGRVFGNIVVSVFYAFLVRALFRGRRWAYRRVIWVGIAGIVALIAIQATPYPTWMRVEQLLQALILAALVYCVLRPEVRGHFAKDLPGRQRKRFGR